MEQIVFNSTSILVEPTYTGCSYSTATSLPSTGYLQVASNYRPVAASSTRGNVSFVGGAQTQTISVGQDFEESLLVTLGMAEAPLRSPRPGGNTSVGELTPIGDAVLPMLACVLVYMCARYYKKVYSFIRSNRFSFMKRSISTSMMAMLAVIMMLFAAPTEADAQRALSQGDTITVSYTTGGHTYYVARNPSNNSVIAVQDHPTLECLWVLATMTGDPSSANGKENKAVVTAVNLMADSLKLPNKYFYMGTSTWSSTSTLSLAATGTSIYTVKSSQSAGQYIMAYILSKSGKNSWYLNYNYGFQSAKNVKNPQTMRIQKWKSVKVEEFHPTFLPNSAVFGYAATPTDTDGQWINASCKLTKREGKYFYDVSDPNIRIVEKEMTETEPDPKTVSFSWAKTGEQQMEFTNPAYNSTTKTWDFTIKPIGASPWSMEERITANPDLFKDSINSIVCHATIDGKPVTAEMQCTRRTYLKHTPPVLEFSVSHSSYRFPVDGGNLTLNPYLYVQNKTEWYNTDNIVEHRDITQVYDPKTHTMVDGFRVTYPDTYGNLQVSVTENADWLTPQALQSLGIPFTATPNQETNAPERSAVVMVHVNYTYYTNNQQQNGTTGTFIRQVILNQDGSMTGAPITFTTKEPKIPAGQPGAGQQAVHTQKQVLYYIPGRNGEYGSEVELHPTELSFYGYRRWYNFDNGRGIQNSDNPANNTIWSDAPHITSNNTAYNFSPINTDNQYSCGVFAVARQNSTCAGFRTLYYGMTDPAPRIRGYKDNNDGKHGGVHTIACDLSTFTDYSITETAGKLTALTEPTLSYRMLFELHPATEIADKIKAVRSYSYSASDWINGKYLEEYEITAPTNTDVHLHTAQRFRTYRYHESELGYFYYQKGQTEDIAHLKRLQSGVDGKNIFFFSHTPGSATLNQIQAVYSPNTDNLIVNSTKTGTIIYTLVLGDRNTDDIRLAKFTVHYVSPTECGPSATALLTNKEMHDRYQVLTTIDWDDEEGVDKPGNQSNVKANYHLPWDEATYGYAHRNPDISQNVRRTNDGLCFFGEYVLANQLTGYSWIDPNIVNRSGKENGYMMYVDGTIEPGIVATIKTNTAICSGQQMYCSAWIANANPAGYTSGSDPIFRFQVQGRNIDRINGKDTIYTDWQDVETFFAGEIHKGSGWQQILFPVNSHRSYIETRVCIYNFATTNKGNDFLIDDISLFATPLPISAYQAASACSGSDIVIVVKVDYNNIADDIHDKDVYYQGWVNIPNPANSGADSITVAIPNLHNYNGYYQWYDKENGSYSNKSRDEVEHSDKITAGTAIQDMGLLHIPAKNFDPENDDYAKDHIAQSVQQYVERLQAEDAADNGDRAGRAGVFYVKGSDGKYAMYLVHLLQAKDGGHYEVRFAEDSVDLPSPLCAMSVKLPIYKKTKITWNDDSNPISTPMTGVCPNVEGHIKVTVTNTRIGENQAQGAQQNAYGRADWLIGIAADTIYGHAYAADAAQPIPYARPQIDTTITTTRADSLKFWKDSADVLFKKYYGYTRQEVQTAFVYDLRRMPYLNNPNPNYNVSDYTKLDPTGFISQRNYDIVRDLCSRGLVDMNVSSRTVMLNPGDSLFLWVFPIVGSAVIDGKELEVCNEPQWVDFRTTKLSGEQTEQIFNPSPIPNEKKTPVQKLMIPSVRVTASKANEVFGVPIMNLQNAYMAWDSLRVIETNDPALKALVDTFRTHYNKWANFSGSGTRPAYPNPAAFSMRYYADKVAQSTNTVKYDQEGYHSDTKDGTWSESNKTGWRYYQPGDTMFFRPIDATHVAYLADRREKSNVFVGDVHQTSPYSASDANWVAKQATEGTGLQPGFQHVNTIKISNDHSEIPMMHANYTYKMTTSLVTYNFQGELNSNNKTQDGCNYATTYFDVIVVPELLIWRPTVSNEWGDDANWHGIVNGVEMDWGFAPLKTSSVIIPVMESNLLYPVVTGDTLYPMSAWYEPASCDNIYMEAGAHILGQEKLNYNKAYVDMPIEHAQWCAMASPMRKMYSGDFFVPQNTGDWSGANLEYKPYTVDANGKVDDLIGSHTGVYGNNANENATLFDPRTFEGTRQSSNPYAFWTNYYNHEVKMHHHNLTNEDATTYTASATFAPSNDVNEIITAGQGIVVLGYGPWAENVKHTIPLRLPKVDPEYKYFLYGEQTQYGELTPRTEDDFRKFAWKSDGAAGATKEQMTVHLHNETAGKQFLMGNPTMAYVDLVAFMKDNSSVLTGTFGYMRDGSWINVSKDILEYADHRFLAPMEAIMVQIDGDEPKTDINVVFKASQLTLDNMEHTSSAPARAPEDPASAPSRAQAASDANAAPIQLMTITAFTDDMEAIAYLGKKEGARNGYLAGEDAYAISSGVEDGTENDDDIVTTPLNIYTVSDSTALMVDLRPGISVVPLHFLTHAAYRTDSVNLICNMNMDWSTPCYFIDSVAGTREPIMNGYVMKIALPENHQSRYYIEGPDPYIQDAPNQPTNPGTATAVETVEAVEEDLTQYPVEKFIINGHLYIRRGPALFHVTGTRLE